MSDDAPAKAVKSKAVVFRERLTSTLILWAIVTGVFVSGNAWAFFGLIAFLTITGSLEFLGMLAGQPGKGCRVIGVVAGLWMVGVTGCCFADDGPSWLSFDREMLGLVVALIAGFCWRFRVGIQGRESVDSVGDGLLAYVYVPVLFGSFVLRLSFLPVIDAAVPGAWLLLMMIAAAKFTDMGAYITGSLIGKNKMAPHLSPAKTWEGFGGALCFAQLAAWSVWYLAGDALAWLPAMHVGILAFLIGLAAVAGDLAESILKRSLEVKDSGSWMPGIGGILDLIDSLCFAAPLTYFYLLIAGLV